MRKLGNNHQEVYWPSRPAHSSTLQRESQIVPKHVLDRVTPVSDKAQQEAAPAVLESAHSLALVAVSEEMW